MKILSLFMVILSFTFCQVVFAQSFEVTKASMSSEIYDEFSPVYYKDGIVFCTNRPTSNLIKYSSGEGKGTIELNYIDTAGNPRWRQAELFSKKLSTRLNDGPVSFRYFGDTLVFSRNLRIEGKLSELLGWNNNLGIFLAEFDGKEWSNISEFRYNNELYNFTTPCLSPDGSRLYFSSDKPGGFGGMDIYYCHKMNGFWDEPINLGPVINTEGNESYPFINEAGEFFFSSDGHGGLGGKDIFVTMQNGIGWSNPIGLEAPVNSQFNDFGIVTDTLTNNGYFSSDRGKSIDIFRFKSLYFHFWFAEKQVDNEYCFSISDIGIIDVDNLRLNYIWKVNDLKLVNDPVAYYCFPGPGKYRISLDLIDRKSGLAYFRKLDLGMEIFNKEKPFINSPEIVITGQHLELDGKLSSFPGYRIEKYYWDLGDSTFMEGAAIKHRYSKTGVFNVKMGVVLRSISTGELIKRSVSRIIRAIENKDALSVLPSDKESVYSDITGVKTNDSFSIFRYYSAEADAARESVFQLVILKSPEKIDVNSPRFKKVSVKYTISEILNPSDSLYYYIADQQMSLMSVYLSFNDLVGSGFRDAFVRLHSLNEAFEKELYGISKAYSNLTDNYFDVSNRLTTSGYMMLDQIAILMNKYPSLKLEVSVHTDDNGTAGFLQRLSLSRAQLMTYYLVSRGINQKRLFTRGFGGSRPVTSNLNPSERSRNRRVEFRILN